MNAASDQSARDRFTQELDRNFSVVASAGSGKTTAITQRVLSIARAPQAVQMLPSLVVVTYANRAADEIQQRARQILLEDNLSPEAQTAFNRAFFGTIHSFCLKLLTDYGHHLGLPVPLDLLTEDEALWREFVQNQTRIGHSLGENNRATLFRFMQARDLMEMARGPRFALPMATELPTFPKFDFADIYAQKDTGKANDNVSKSQAELREWEKRFASDWEYLRWPARFTSDNSKFSELWAQGFAPLRQWVSAAAMNVAGEVQRAYREFRLERGLVTYDDQIALAKELLAHPIAAARIRAEKFRILLDEAQDTGPAQFAALLETARPPHAAGEWMQTRVDPPPPGHFCMVGDFQQSIYGERADLKYYDDVHQALITHAGGEALKFSVTFRLDEKQLACVNETFREILHGREDQVQFVELHPRPEILPGKVIRVSLPRELLEGDENLKENEKARIEARYLAQWIKEAGLPKLSADSWREVAILCPRKAWLQTLAAALRQLDLPVVIQSEREVKGDSPAYAWLTALLTIMTDPLNAYEIAGVLREIFGVSDHDLAVFSEGQGNRFRIDEELTAAGKVSSHLRALARTRKRLHNLALFDAVTLIVTETLLRERLSILPATEFGNLARELDVLLAQTAEAEASGIILAAFAEGLRNDFTTERAVRFAANENAIQLITSQKAKGSEWQAVIVPFLGRDLGLPAPRYPHLVRPPGDGVPFIALNRDDKAEVKEAIERAFQQQIERLLYVATTRARRTLVLVLDQEIFSTKNGQLQKNAQLCRLVSGNSFYAGEFDELASTIDTVKDLLPSTPAIPEDRIKIEMISAKELKRVANRAGDFIRKFTPSTLEGEDVSETYPRARPDNPATLYGRWWHKLLEEIDWKRGRETAGQLFEKRRRTSPNEMLAVKDWGATEKNLFDDENIRRFVSHEGTLFRSEFPFSWRRNDRSVLEGLIDSLMINHALGECLLIDWKTNDVSSGEVEKLRIRYRPQLAAYWKAVSEITGLTVNAALFSTALGRFLPYEQADLRAEWERLEQVPPARFEEEILADD